MTTTFQRLLPVSMMAAGVALITVSLFSSRPADARRDRGDRCTNEVSRYQAEVQRLNDELLVYQGALQELYAGLDSLERMVSRRVTDQRVQARLQRSITQARDRATQYFAPAPATQPSVTVTQPHVTITVDPHAGAPGHGSHNYNTPQAMTPREFARLQKAVADASFASERIDLVRAAVQHNLFTVAQVVSLVTSCSFDKTKIEIAALIYPNVVDLKAWYQVYNAFDFQSSRDKLRKLVERR